jgi:hypothetical protein
MDGRGEIVNISDNRAVGEPFRPSVAGVRTVTESSGDAAPKAGIPGHFFLPAHIPAWSYEGRVELADIIPLVV